MARTRPRVTWAFATTLDGRTAAPDGTSRWISSAEARADAHRLRAAHDAVLVGSGTLRADDPHLGLRHGVGGTPPKRVVLDTRAAIVGAESRVADASAPTIVVVAAGTDPSRLPASVEVMAVAVGADGRLDLVELLRALRGRGIRTVLVEGGATLAAALLEGELIDRVVAYVAPAILGAGSPLVALTDVTTIADLRRFSLDEVTVVGRDVRISMAARRR